MSQCYVVGEIKVKDPAKWVEYTKGVPDTLRPWGAELVFRGKQVAAFAGHNPQPDIVVLRFADEASAQGWFASAAYQALIPLRQQAADVVLTCYQA